MQTLSQPSAATARSSFFQARLASALAIAPLGVWTVVHLWHNLSAFDGADAWQQAVTGYAHPFAEAAASIAVAPAARHPHRVGIALLGASSRPEQPPLQLLYGNLKYLSILAAVKACSSSLERISGSR